MRSLLVVLAIAAVLGLACGGDGGNGTTASDESEIEQVISNYYSAYNAEELARCLTYCTEYGDEAEALAWLTLGRALAGDVTVFSIEDIVITGSTATAKVTTQCGGETDTTTMPLKKVGTWKLVLETATDQNGNGDGVDDTTPPILSSIQSSPGTTSCTVEWVTDEPATSQVEYGTTDAYGSSSALDATLVTDHSVALNGLSGDTTYHYRVRSKDASGNESLSPDRTFTTGEPITLTGTGDKTTALFQVACDEWQIDWSYEPANAYDVFGFYVYPEGETVSYIESVTAGAWTSDSTYLYEGDGSYYIEVLAANVENWTIEVIPGPVTTVPSIPVTFTGSGDKTTTPFHVDGNQFHIDWSYIPENAYDVFGFYVYPRGETTMYVESVMSTTGTSDTTWVYEGPGDYYVQVLSANIESWSIAVE